MNWTIIIIETIIMTIAFTAMILIPLVKNPVWWIHDYPKDIQEEYFKTHERVWHLALHRLVRLFLSRLGALCKHEVCPAPRHGAHGCSLPSETLPLCAVPMGHAHRFHSLSRRSRTIRLDYWIRI